MNDYEDSWEACLLASPYLPTTTYFPTIRAVDFCSPFAPCRSLDTPVHVVLHRLCVAVLTVHVLLTEGYLPIYPTTCVQKRFVHSSNYNPCEKRDRERHRRIIFAVR